MISLTSMARTALPSMIPLFLTAEHGLSPERVGLTFSVLLGAGAVLQPWVGKVSDRLARRVVLVLGNLGTRLASGALMLQPSFWAMIAAMAVAVAALDAIRAPMLAAAVDHTDHRQGTTLGLAFVLMEGVGAFGAVFAGLALAVAALTWGSGGVWPGRW